MKRPYLSSLSMLYKFAHYSSTDTFSDSNEQSNVRPASIAIESVFSQVIHVPKQVLKNYI